MSKNFLNWKQISIKLSESDNAIRKNKIPKKYKPKIDELLDFLDTWSKNKNR